jgi:hypothetical protein
VVTGRTVAPGRSGGENRKKSLDRAEVQFLELKLEPQGADAQWPPEVILMSERPPYTIQRYFAGLTETTFEGELGIVDPPLVDYVADLLCRFVRLDVVNRIRGLSGRPLMTVGEMAAEAAHRLGSARRELYRQIGDFTLFWAGVYPEALRPGGGAQRDQYGDYCEQGKRSYHLASQAEAGSEESPPDEVLVRLSERFELCCYGLREVRRHWEEGDGGTAAGTGLLL